MRLGLPILTALLLTIPTAAVAEPAPLTGDALLGAARQDADVLAGVAAAFPRGQGLGGALGALTGAASAAPSLASLEDALAALYAEAGIDAAPASPPDAALAAALAPLVQGAADSARLTREAFADLTPEEKTFALANIDLLLAPDGAAPSGEAAARVQALAARVDVPKLQLGASGLAAALDAFAFSPPPSGALTWIDPSGLIEVGSTSTDAYCDERVLIVDLGGNDRYSCHPASYAPDSTLPVPVSVILDLGGNDWYYTGALHQFSSTSTWGQGVGIGGVGLIVDRWGDDSYQTYLADASQACGSDFLTGSPQYVYTQGVGALGVGAILDASGNDQYNAVNTNSVFNYCHFGWVYTFAQGVGLVGGVGLVVDDTGDDYYQTYSYAYGKADNIASTFAQAAAAGGIGALVDKEGSDGYYAQAYSGITYGYSKGAFSYVFSQASVTATRKQPDALGGQALADIGTPLGLAGLLCPSVDKDTGGYSEGGACDAAGLAVLVDVLGDDLWYAVANANDYNNGCYNGLWAVVSSQGSAAWSGAAALVNLDVEGRDTFHMESVATGANCGYPATRAHSYGQGYGGPILWDFWDAPQPAGATQVPVGILASLGVPEETCVGDQSVAPQLLPVSAPVTAIRDPCPRYDSLLPHLTASPDVYDASATATNPQGTADAQAWVQGSSGSATSLPTYYNAATYKAVGVGVNLDIGGDDVYLAQTDANGPTTTTLVLGQGATMSAISVAANIGGADKYVADARVKGTSVTTQTLVQGYADAGTGVTTPGPACVATSLILVCVYPMTVAAGGIAVFIDVFGEDYYSEAPERAGCQGNGTLLGTWPVGAPLGPVWWGTVVNHPCGTTPGVGNGTVIAVDYWSEAN